MKKTALKWILTAGLAALSITACQPKAESSTTAAASAETSANAESAASAETKTLAEGEFQFVSAEDTVKAAKGSDVHILDVREWEAYSAGKVANSQWSPIFPLEDVGLEGSLKEYASANLNDGKNIYIVCNSGKRGAEKATQVLRDAGIEANKIYTVEGGAKALAEVKDGLTTNRVEEPIDWKYIDAKDFLALEGVQTLDVRDAQTFAEGHLADSVNLPLKEIEDAAAQTAVFEYAKTSLDSSKPVYLLCYSGNKCAKTGISVLKDAGFDVNNVFIIKDGAKDADISGAFVK